MLLQSELHVFHGWIHLCVVRGGRPRMVGSTFHLFGLPTPAWQPERQTQRVSIFVSSYVQYYSTLIFLLEKCFYPYCWHPITELSLTAFLTNRLFPGRCKDSRFNFRSDRDNCCQQTEKSHYVPIFYIKLSLGM